MNRNVLPAMLALLLGLPLFARADEKFLFPVAASSKVLGYAPLWAADKKGFFAREGLDVSVGGSGPSLMALGSGNIDASILAVPLNFKAQQMGFNLIGKVTDVFPNYLLSSFSVRRDSAAAHRKEVVRFLTGLLHARRWLEENQADAISFLADDLK